MLNHFGFDTRLRRGGPSRPEELVRRAGLGPEAPAMQRPLSPSGPFLCMASHSFLVILPVRLPLSGWADCVSLWLPLALAASLSRLFVRPTSQGLAIHGVSS